MNNKQYKFDAMAHAGGPSGGTDSRAEVLHQFMDRLSPDMQREIGYSPDKDYTDDSKEQWRIFRSLLNHDKLGGILGTALQEGGLFLKDTLKIAEETDDGQGIHLIDPVSSPDGIDVTHVVMHWSEIPAIIERLQQFYDSSSKEPLLPDDDNITREYFLDKVVQSLDAMRELGLKDEMIDRLKRASEELMERMFDGRESMPRSEANTYLRGLKDDISGGDDVFGGWFND